MPAVSKAQLRFMAGVASGAIKPPKGLTRKQAAEWVHSTKNAKKLPQHKKKKR